MDKPVFETQIVSSVPEHQCLLSFVNDDDALWFYEWWHYHGGEKMFLEYVEDAKRDT